MSLAQVSEELEQKQKKVDQLDRRLADATGGNKGSGDAQLGTFSGSGGQQFVLEGKDRKKAETELEQLETDIALLNGRYTELESRTTTQRKAQ